MSYTLDDWRMLKNRFGATDHEALERYEHPKTAQRILEIRAGRGPAPTLDERHLKGLHKHLFQDVFEWAGHYRHQPFALSDGTIAVDPVIRKIGGKSFAVGDEISLGLKRLMSALREKDYLRGLDRRAFADEAASFFAQLNNVHPFREGNGRTQREFVMALAARAGHGVDFDVISAARMTRVSVAAHEHGDIAPLRRMFVEISDPARIRALESAQYSIERFRPADPSRVSAWDHVYMATTEPGRRYEGRFAGAARDDFMMQNADGAIIIGRSVDLPEPRPRSGDAISFTASEVDLWADPPAST